ncbi:MAG: hypothetical protein PHW49_06740 [Acinetobacter harbinensis]|nr:hypothetical protein [Acinetobacter sp.]MBR5557213.1 hypothetical protein [Acinetobacter sp.]MDD2940411.1 hypothetical protein [Acinetobacter harbinensis]
MNLQDEFEIEIAAATHPTYKKIIKINQLMNKYFKYRAYITVRFGFELYL